MEIPHTIMSTPSSVPSIGDTVQTTHPVSTQSQAETQGIVVGIGLPLLLIRCEHVIALDKYVVRHVDDVRVAVPSS